MGKLTGGKKCRFGKTEDLWGPEQEGDFKNRSVEILTAEYKKALVAPPSAVSGNHRNVCRYHTGTSGEDRCGICEYKQEAAQNKVILLAARSKLTFR